MGIITSITTIITTTCAALGVTACSPIHGGTTTGANTVTSGQISLAQYPETSYDGIVKAINGAHSSVQVEMYSFKDTNIENALIAATKRGVQVNVMLDSANNMQTPNHQAYATLQTNKVPVKWAPTGYIFHDKVLVIDKKTAYISTANWNPADYKYRDALITDTNPTQVTAISQTLANDWTLKGKPKDNTVQASGLVWSPNATDTFIDWINSAHKSIAIETEEFTSTKALAAVEAVARRGVKCTLLMNKDSENTPTFKALSAAGCKGYQTSPSTNYVHEKAIDVDDSKVLIGSTNLGNYSMSRNRELSVELTQPQIVKAVSSQITGDEAKATLYR